MRSKTNEKRALKQWPHDYSFASLEAAFFFHVWAMSGPYSTFNNNNNVLM